MVVAVLIVIIMEIGWDGSSGGGASDIRINTNSLYARIIVAGGGGGTADGSQSSAIINSGYGGGVSGGNGAGSYGPGYGGLQTSGGQVNPYVYDNLYAVAGTFGNGRFLSINFWKYRRRWRWSVAGMVDLLVYGQQLVVVQDMFIHQVLPQIIQVVAY